MFPRGGDRQLSSRTEELSDTPPNQELQRARFARR